MRYGISRFFFLMDNLQTQILNKVMNAIDSDDILEIASCTESNLSKEQLDEFKKILIKYIYENPNSVSVKQLINFLF